MKEVLSIVVLYNGEKWADRCFGSLVRSSIMAHRIVAIDNGCTDGTVQLIRTHFPQISIIDARENLGFGKANNIGIMNALEDNTDYVFLLNQDAWVEQDTIRILVETATNHPDFGIISPMHMNGLNTALDWNFSNYIIPNKCPDLYSDLYFNNTKDLYEVTFVNAAAWLLTRKCIQEVGLFDPIFFLYGEDSNYVARTRKHQLKIGITPLTKISHDREERKGQWNIQDYRLKKRTQTHKILLNSSRKHYHNYWVFLGHSIRSIIEESKDVKKTLIIAGEFFYGIFKFFYFYRRLKYYRSKGAFIR
jgi:GT2 family glycosyltransferase